MNSLASPHTPCVWIHAWIDACFQDGHDLPPPIGFDVEAPTAIPPCKVTRFVLLDGHGT